LTGLDGRMELDGLRFRAFAVYELASAVYDDFI
jgi:hypothetical protein